MCRVKRSFVARGNKMQLNRNWPTRIRYDSRPGWSDFIYFRPSVAINSLASPPIFPLRFPSSTFVIPLSLSLSLSLSKLSVPWHTPARLCRIVPRCATRPRCVPHLSRFSLFPPTVTQFAAGIVSSAHASGSRLHRGASAPGFHTLLLLLFPPCHATSWLPASISLSLSLSFSLHFDTFVHSIRSFFLSLSFLVIFNATKNDNCSREIEYTEYEYAQERWDIAGVGYSRGSKNERVLEKRRRVTRLVSLVERKRDRMSTKRA